MDELIINKKKACPAKLQRSGGFLTLEMMIAMVIMLTAVSAVIMTSFGDQNFLIGGQTNSEALNKAQEMLEQQQAYARKDFRTVNSVATIVDGIYNKTITVGPSSVANDYFTKKVTSLVTWTDYSHITRSVSLSTLVTNFENALGGDTCNSYLTGNWASPAVTHLTLGNIIGDSAGTYPITDMDVYNGKMYVAVNQSSQSVGPNNPTVGTDVSGAGTVSWNSPSNVLSSNGSNAVSASTLNSGNETHYLKANNFGFSIPTGATILGVKVEIQKSRGASGAGNIVDSQVKLVRSDSTIGTTNKADTITSWSSSGTYASYGSASDLWGIPLSPAEVNSANFGAVITAKGSSGGTRTAQVDHIRITVTYIKEFYILNTTNPTAPTYVSGLANSVSNTGLNAVKTDGHYAYVATNAGPSTGQLQIIDVSVTPPVVVNTTIMTGVTGNAGQALGNSIFYKNGYVYLGLSKTLSGPEFNIVDVHNPSSPVWLGGYPVGSAVNNIYVRGSTAYLGVSDNTKEFITLDISNPSAPTLKTSYDATPDQSGFGYGRSQYLVGDTWYLGRTYISNAPEYTALNIASTPAILQSKDIGPNSTNSFSLNSLIVRDYLAFLLSGSGSKGGTLQIIKTVDSSQYATPITLPSGATSVGGTAMDCEGNYIFAGSVDTTNKGYITIVAGS